MNEAENAVRRGPDKQPSQFPNEIKECSLPDSFLNIQLENGVTAPRHWFVWSK